jgi:glutamate-1-semialdehyde 2,1-aminomutase
VQAHVNRMLREGGILKGDSKYYVSTAHEPRDVDQTLEAFARAMSTLPRATA